MFVLLWNTLAANHMPFSWYCMMYKYLVIFFSIENHWFRPNTQLHWQKCNPKCARTLHHASLLSADTYYYMSL